MPGYRICLLHLVLNISVDALHRIVQAAVADSKTIVGPVPICFSASDVPIGCRGGPAKSSTREGVVSLWLLCGLEDV